MRHAEIPAVFLIRDVVAQGGGRDARGAVRVEVGGETRVADLGGGDGGDGAAEGVADDGEGVGWVYGGGGLEGGEDAGAGFEPAVVAVFWGGFSGFSFRGVARGICGRWRGIGLDWIGWVRGITYKPWWHKH